MVHLSFFKAYRTEESSTSKFGITIIMVIIGLTGSIAMGKSTTAQMFMKMHIPVYDADKTVHGLFQKGGEAVDKIAFSFPSSVVDGAIDRNRLGALVFKDTNNNTHPPIITTNGIKFLDMDIFIFKNIY